VVWSDGQSEPSHTQPIKSISYLVIGNVLVYQHPHFHCPDQLEAGLAYRLVPIIALQGLATRLCVRLCKKE
jgi:hypothetical protein